MFIYISVLSISLKIMNFKKGILILIILSFKSIKCQREGQYFCSTLLECMAMGQTVINPRYITNLQELDDRAVKYNQEYIENPQLRVATLNQKMQNMQEAHELEREIYDLELQQKIREIDFIRGRTAKLLKEI